jgi:uncharacterized membrane protein YhhN
VTAAAWQLVALAASAALIDWAAIIGGRVRLEYVVKPLVLFLLVAAALSAGPGNAEARPWLVLALAASLVGDVFLLPAGSFPLGLLAFLVAQLAYLGAFANQPGDAALLAAAIAGSVVLAGTLGRAIVRGTPRALRLPVGVYLVVVCLMAVAATRTGRPLAIAGAWLFVASDSVLGWDRFAARTPASTHDRVGRRLAVIVPYHVAQGLLLVALAG